MILTKVDNPTFLKKNVIISIKYLNFATNPLKIYQHFILLIKLLDKTSNKNRRIQLLKLG